MLKFGKIRRGSAIMSRAIKAELKRSNQYASFCSLINRIKLNGMTSVQLSQLTPLMLQSLVSLCSMSKEIQKEGLGSLALALLLKKRQIKAGNYNCRRQCVKSILMFQSAKRSSENYHFVFGKEVVVIAA